MSKIDFSNKPKIILAIFSIACAVSGFLPWISVSVGDSSYHENSGSLSTVFLICGLVPLLLDIATIATREKALSVLTTVLGVISSLVALGYVGIVAFGFSVTQLGGYRGIGFWVALIGAIGMFVFSIASASSKKETKKHQR